MKLNIDKLILAAPNRLAVTIASQGIYNWYESSLLGLTLAGQFSLPSSNECDRRADNTMHPRVSKYKSSIGAKRTAATLKTNF